MDAGIELGEEGQLLVRKRHRPATESRVCRRARDLRIVHRQFARPATRPVHLDVCHRAVRHVALDCTARHHAPADVLPLGDLGLVAGFPLHVLVQRAGRIASHLLLRRHAGQPLFAQLLLAAHGRVQIRAFVRPRRVALERPLDALQRGHHAGAVLDRIAQVRRGTQGLGQAVFFRLHFFQLVQFEVRGRPLERPLCLCKA